MTTDDGEAGRPDEPVSAVLRDAKARARSTHYTVGTLRTDADGTLSLECSCGTVLSNGPTWSLDEHVRLHRAEATYLELSAAAPPGIPRLIDPGADRGPVVGGGPDQRR